MPTARCGLTAAIVNDQIYAFAGSTYVVFSPPLRVTEQYTPFGYGSIFISELIPYVIVAILIFILCIIAYLKYRPKS